MPGSLARVIVYPPLVCTLSDSQHVQGNKETTIHYSGGGGGGSPRGFVIRVYMFRPRTVLEVNYLFHTEFARNYLTPWRLKGGLK